MKNGKLLLPTLQLLTASSHLPLDWAQEQGTTEAPRRQWSDRGLEWVSRPLGILCSDYCAKAAFPVGKEKGALSLCALGSIRLNSGSMECPQPCSKLCL